MNYLKNGIVYFIVIIIFNSRKWKIKRIFDNNLISKCIDFILGEKSLTFKEDNRTSMKNIKGKFEDLIEIYHILLEFKNIWYWHKMH